MALSARQLGRLTGPRRSAAVVACLVWTALLVGATVYAVQTIGFLKTADVEGISRISGGIAPGIVRWFFDFASWVLWLAVGLNLAAVVALVIPRRWGRPLAVALLAAALVSLAAAGFLYWSPDEFVGRLHPVPAAEGSAGVAFWLEAVALVGLALYPILKRLGLSAPTTTNHTA